MGSNGTTITSMLSSPSITLTCAYCQCLTYEVAFGCSAHGEHQEWAGEGSQLLGRHTPQNPCGV